MLLQTDLLGVISERVAGEFAGLGIRAVKLPFKSSAFSWRLYWHRRYDSSRAHQWMRELVRSACA